MIKSNSIFAFIFLLLIAACANSTDVDKENMELKVPSSFPTIADTAKNDIQTNNWLDDSISNYIKLSQMELIVLDRKNNEHISWMIDEQERNNKIYFAVKIGRDFEDRFVSDGWIYIDSESRQIYEYDLAADSLIEFKH